MSKIVSRWKLPLSVILRQALNRLLNRKPKIQYKGSYRMPNYVKNKLVIDADEEKVSEILNFIKGKETAFDFNTLVPMPDELNIESGSVTEDSVIVCKYLDTNVETQEFQAFLDRHRKLSESVDRCISRLQKLRIINLELGRKAIRNLDKYGATDFYYWRIKNWGTKWNALNTIVADNIIEFDTAWSAPLRVIKVLSDKFPDVYFGYKWADEDIGANTGEGTYKNGHSTNLAFYDNCEHDALRIYEECWGQSDCVGKDKYGNYYRKSCDRCRLCD